MYKYGMQLGSQAQDKYSMYVYAYIFIHFCVYLSTYLKHAATQKVESNSIVSEPLGLGGDH